ncbi:PBP1A family penicillin-binding protein [Gracilibacillus caseinilyticus]|uniref:PBP1A family penicillin-binding protein n=1 Tax=Gracilibacillus caseinilyticus TaxID=2932256 RepID=A0ABY4ES73_9BACI|nr:PBP1A family penicillin-binding protein [Gracilibacillus caseinilyticus]UOQ46820.1 PBP1A family penicillin-binding protein [Gracilibacillus caseinilyticus]
MDKAKLKEFLQTIWSTVKRYKWFSITISTMIGLSICAYLFLIFGGRFVFDERAVILPTASKVVAEDGTVLGKLYTENRDYVTLDEIPDHVEAAFLAVEDQRFYEHAGVSFPAVARAVYRDVLAMSKVEGGSTITQQLAKNLFLVHDKTWMRKTKEVMASIYLERNYSKSQILELYLNEIYLAHGVHGIGTAATYYFGKPIQDLTIDEGALLAAMVKAPNSYSPFNDIEKAKERRNLVLSQMESTGDISTEQLLTYQATTIKTAEQEEERDPWLDDYFAYVLDELESDYDLSREALKRGGFTVEVAMDPSIQKIAYDHVQNDEHFHGSNDQVEASFVLMDQQTSKLKALIAGRDFQLNKTNHLLTNQQPGSLMKPLAVYGPAMQLGDYQPYDMLPDKDIDYDGYRVTNADGNYAGEVTMYDAVKESKNAPAVWLLDQIGISYSKSILEKMDITLKDQGLAIALGGLENGITPIQVAEGFRTFIHQGEWTHASSIEAVYDKEQELVKSQEQKAVNVFNTQTAWNMLRMLEAVVKEGTGSSGTFSKALAGKTGSTQHTAVDGAVKDAWFAGITPSYVMTTWIGYDEATEDNYLTEGSSQATALTKSILTEIDKRTPMDEAFQQPDGVEDLPEPIVLPTITDLDASMKLGGLSLLQGELTWSAAEDSRIIYRIYEQSEDGEHMIGEVEGKGSYTISPMNVFKTRKYYVVPYNPLTEQAGDVSNIATLKFDF